jgi:hypothetical protein
MADVKQVSEYVIDYAERLAAMSDAAKGKGVSRGTTGTRWLILPAAGAGLYALVTNKSVARQAKGVVEQAKTRASELPEDLLHRVRQTAQKQPSRSGGQSNSTRRTGPARTASSARKSRSARTSSSSR